nr:uncharacterized protein LOC109729639 [Microcebus murinus]
MAEKATLAVPSMRLAQPQFGTEPRLGQPSREPPQPVWKTRDAASAPRTPRRAERAGALAPSRPSGFPLLSAPPPALASSSGRGRGSTPLFGCERTETRSARRGPVAAINLRAGPPSSCSRTGAPGPPRVPGRARRPALPVTAWKARDCAGDQAGASPFAKEREHRGPLGATTIHPGWRRTPKWPGLTGPPPWVVEPGHHAARKSKQSEEASSPGWAQLTTCTHMPAVSEPSWKWIP